MADSHHALLAPSGIWGRCPGSLRAQRGRPDRNKYREDAIRGDAAHWVWDQVINAYKHGDSSPNELICNHYVGQTDPAGTVIDEEIAAGAQVFVDGVLSLCQKYGAMQWVLPEYRVFCPQIHPVHCYGTTDLGLVLAAEKTIFVLDYKNGHREVSPIENDQMMTYVAGLVNEYKIQSDLGWTVVMKVVQPFCYQAADDVREWVVPLPALRPHFNRLHNHGHEALGDNPRLIAGAHCRDCKAAHDCPALRKTCYNLVDFVKQPYAMDEMQGADLAAERHILKSGEKLIKARLEAIEDELEDRVEKGDMSTGLLLQEKVGRLKWVKPTAEVVKFCQVFNVDPRKEDLYTPTQVTSKVPAAMRDGFTTALKKFATRPIGGKTLVDAENTIASRVFKKRK